MTTMDRWVQSLVERNERWAVWISHAIAIGMILCAALTVDQFLRRLIPAWGENLAPVLGFLVSIEAMYTKRALGRRSVLKLDWWLYRGTEWVVLLVGVRLWLYAVQGFEGFLEDLRFLAQDFSGTFFSAEYLLLLGVIFLTWGASNLFAEDLQLLEGDRDIVDFQMLGIAMQERSFGRTLLLNRIFLLGLIMVILTALVRADVGILWGDRTRVETSGLYVFVYFILGLALLSMTHFSTLRATWVGEKVPFSGELARRWGLYALAFLLVVGALVLFLPTGFSLGPLDVLAYLISWVFFISFVVYSLLLFALVSLANFFFGAAEPARFNVDQPPPVPPGADLVSGEAAYPWLILAQNVLFWLVFLAVVGYAFYQFFRQHEALWEQISRAPLLRWVVRFMEALAGWARRGNRAVTEAVRSRVDQLRQRREGSARPGRFRLVNPLRYSPRERVQFFYLALVRRARERGIPRKPSETPDEYKNTLKEFLPEVEGDLDAFTETFVEARYSQHPITGDQAGVVRKIWDRIRRSLQRWRGR